MNGWFDPHEYRSEVMWDSQSSPVHDLDAPGPGPGGGHFSRRPRSRPRHTVPELPELPWPLV